MKGISFVFFVLFLQASASFLEEFRGAMHNIERGFGKLIGDVVTDVEDTIHCTISAVEHVLVLNGLLDKRSAYSDKCIGQGIAKEPRPYYRNRVLNSNIWKHSDNHYEHSHNLISHELGNSIKNVNKTIDDILGNHVKLKSVSHTFKEETNRLTEISKILKKELENISSNVKNEINKINFDKNELAVKPIWDEIKILNDIQQRSNNSAEVKEIRRVMKEIVSEMHLKMNTNQTLNTHELKEIRKELQKYTHKEKFNNVENQTVIQAPKKLVLKTDLSSKIIKEVARKSSNIQYIYNKHDSKSQKESLLSEKSIFSDDFDDSHYLTPFSNSESVSKDVIENAKKIIEDSQQTDKVLDNLFKKQHEGIDGFNNQDIFNFG